MFWSFRIHLFMHEAVGELTNMFIIKYKTLVWILIAVVFLNTACTQEAEVTEVAEVPKETAVATSLSARLSELQGLVEIKQVDEQEFSEANSKSILGLNGQIRTGQNGKARLDLSTGTIVRVSPSSLFTLVSNEEAGDGLDTKLKLDFGRIFIILSGGSLAVDTPSGVASVRGSLMMVEVDPNTFNILVTCLEGNCSASNQAGTVNFTDGEKTVLFAFDPETGQFLPPTVSPMSDEDYQKWLEENPEAAAIINSAIATITALAAQGVFAPQNGGSSSGSGGSGCFSLLEPTGGSDFFTFGGVNFSWGAQAGAATYVLQFTYPGGQVVQFETTGTDMTRFIESMPAGGSYTWDVTAYDANGSSICTSDSLVFTKADTDAWLEQQKQKQKKKDAPTPTEPPCDIYDPEGDCYIETE